MQSDSTLGRILLCKNWLDSISYSSPYAKMFLRAECPCKSSRNRILCDFLTRYTACLTKSIYGNTSTSVVLKFLFKSCPMRLVRWLPTKTPSGLTMGTMKKSKASLSSAVSSTVFKKVSKAQLETVSPG